MVEFSENLEFSLRRSLDFANYGAKEYITLEHLLFALTWDEDAANVMEACKADVVSLRYRLRSYIESELGGVSDIENTTDPQLTANFQRVIHRAIISAQSSGIKNITGGNVLLALFAERESKAFCFLREQGMARLAVAKILRNRQEGRVHSIVSKAKNKVVDKSATKPTKANKVFISYRRKDSAGSTGRISDKLKGELGNELVFLDVDEIPLGVNVIEYLGGEVSKCDVMLVIIGPNWLDMCDEENKRRLEDKDDFVRVEIRSAFKEEIPIIPILVDGANIPKATQLPNDIEELSFCNGLNVRHDSFHMDIDKLVKDLKPRLGLST